MFVDDFLSYSYIYYSYLKAYKGRKKKFDVIFYKYNLENNLIYFRSRLKNFTYKHGKYKTFVVKDSKKRKINAPSFEDHILHHMIFTKLEEVFDKKFIENSYANRIGKGSHRAVLKLKSKLFSFDYFLKLDIDKYFQSINHKVIYSQINRYIKDEIFLYYLKLVLDSYYDKFDYVKNIKYGMPIGNITSQIFANIYLHDLDFYVEHTLKPYFRSLNRDLFYIRYVDDFVFLGKTLEDLKFVRDLVLSFLNIKLDLKVSHRKQILNKVKFGISFLGYIIFRNRLKVKNDTLRRFKKKVKKCDDNKKLNSLISFKGYCDISNKNLIFSLVRSVYGGDNKII